MLYTKLPTSAIDFDDSVNGGVYGNIGPCPLISGNVHNFFAKYCINFLFTNLMVMIIIAHIFIMHAVFNV